MRDMVKRDRNHPSVVVWSFCNEYECEQQDADFSAAAFRAAALGVDGTRALTANHYGDAGLSAHLDVQVHSEPRPRCPPARRSFSARTPGAPALSARSQS